MADGGTFPHVVHRPDNRFAGGDDLLNIVQGQHALIDPMQVNDICLFEKRKPGDIEPRIGNGDFHGVSFLFSTLQTYETIFEKKIIFI